MTRETRPRIRRAPLPESAVLVVRGDELDPHVLGHDAQNFRRRFPDWRRYGISAFYAADDEEVDALCQTKLVRFPTIVVFERVDLEGTGIEIVGTFRTPHVTLAHRQLECLIETLMSCPHKLVLNPYNEE